MILTGETGVLGDKVPQCQFVHLKPHMECPGIEPGPEVLHNSPKALI
jgi:hypothetical protein